MYASKQEIILIAAVSRNNVIGIDGKMPWDIKEDMGQFKELTLGHPVIMGRVTYNSISKKFRPLANRQNVVLTNNNYFREKGVYVAHSLEDALDVLQERSVFKDGIDYTKVFIGGGQQVYEAAMEYATSLEITHVGQHVEGLNMRRFPKIDASKWQEQKRADKQGYSFVTYVRK